MPWDKRKVDGEWCVFKQGEDKALKCYAAEKDANDYLAALYASEDFAAGTLDAEIFAAGKWNGHEFSAEDLNKIAETFSALGDNMRVPLKMGHNDEQPMTDGQPALGWVQKVWVAGSKLMASFSDVPAIVAKAMAKKLYRNVSIELDVDVNYKGATYPYVLSGVALLGADIPAVNTLKDLTHYMGRGRRMAFTAIAGINQTGDSTMTEAEIKALAEQNAKLIAEKAAADAELLRFRTENDLRAKAEVATKIKAKREEAEGILEQAVKDSKITPAQRTQYSKVLRLADDAAVTALDMQDVRDLIGTSPAKFGREEMRSGEGSGDEITATDKLTTEIQAMLAKGEAKNFAQAQQIAFRRDPKAAREWLNSNGTAGR